MSKELLKEITISVPECCGVCPFYFRDYDGHQFCNSRLFIDDMVYEATPEKALECDFKECSFLSEDK